MGCVTHPWFSTLINSTSKGFFYASHGIRQGDLLSFFLFFLVADSLSALLLHAVCANIVKGKSFQILASNLTIFYLQFADDTLIFSNSSPQAIRNLKYTLQIFEVISGFNVNWGKSTIIGIHVDNVYPLADILGCKVEAWLLKYLGLPLGGQSHLTSFWDPMIEKVDKMLASWKKNNISFGGRITLIKAVLANIPIYYMSMFSIPSKVAKKIEQLQKELSLGMGRKQKGSSSKLEHCLQI